ncbi:MAG TPA: porphobilinogen synthase, partial [bacterium]|nr:porphobilinogen synthase [bacterium]
MTPDDLILPLFVSPADRPKPVASMPGVSQLPVRDAVKAIRQWRRAGLRQFILFGVTPAQKKDATGSFAADPDAPVNRALA